MLRRSPTLPGLVFAIATAALLTACETEPDRPADTDLDTIPQQPVTPDRGEAAQPQEIYEVRLQERDGSGVTGTATFTIQDDELQVTVAATGLPPNTRVPQHIHTNATCDDAGGILLNLDSDLSAADEGEARGDTYPESDDEGRLQYEASRSLDDLRQELGDQGAEDANGLDLGNRVLNLHGEDMQPIACGELERTGQVGQPGQTPQP